MIPGSWLFYRQSWKRDPLVLLLCAGLLNITLFSACASPAPQAGKDVSPAEQLKTLGSEITQAMEALGKGDVAAAKHAFEEFDEGWDRIEDGIKEKSGDSYREIEEAMDEVESALIRPEKPDNAKALAALRKLDGTIQAALPRLR